MFDASVGQLYVLLAINFVRCVCQKNVTILSIQAASGVSSSLQIIGPAIDLGLKEINEMYAPDYRFHLVDMNNSNTKSCTDVERDGLPFGSKYFWKSRSALEAIVLLAPGSHVWHVNIS